MGFTTRRRVSIPPPLNGLYPALRDHITIIKAVLQSATYFRFCY